MTRAITPAAFAVPPSPLSASAGPVIVPIDPPVNRAVSGPVKDAGLTLNADGLARLQMLRLVRLECLLAEAKALRNQRKSKQASICEAQIGALRLEIYRAGIAQRAAAGRAI